ncbi:MAG TPA: N-formylglutamate amidohydrolase [Alphaproteobacteria bacterium]|nr:N-formylglutamate amidohydrolase [Alphaproteobacteria bacterium]
MPKKTQPHPAFSLIHADGDPSVLLVCDHASNAVPAEFNGLGLPPEAFTRHIAYDIGAAQVTAALSRLLNAPAILAGFSRLLIDPNRGADDPTLVMKLSDGAIIPGNRHADAAVIADRIARYYRPYHQAIADRIAAARAKGVAPAILSLHSFTPVFQGRERPWQIGILWDRDARIAAPLLASLRADGKLCVGDNQPYSGELVGDCMYQHGTMNRLPHVLIEVRQDLIVDKSGAEHWAQLLAEVLQPILKKLER